MSDKQFVLKALNAIPPFASGIIIFYLTSIKENKISKLNTLKERMTLLYIPFYKFYYRKMLYKNDLSSFSDEIIKEVFDLLSNNLHNMDTKSQLLYTDFYLAFCDLLKACDGNAGYFLSECNYCLDKAFNNLSLQLLREYKGICRKLRLPKPIMPNVYNRRSLRQDT